MTAKALRLSQPALFGLRGVGSELSLSPDPFTLTPLLS